INLLFLTHHVTCPPHFVSETPDEPWSSTPVKKLFHFVGFYLSDALMFTLCLVVSLCPALLKLRVNDLSVSTIQKQRKELQLLMAELKDRDQELNSMAASHHRQIQAWEQDRQKVLCLEQRCSRLEDMLQKRDEMIRALKKRILVVELEEKEVQKVLSAAQHQLHEFEQNQQHVNQRCQDWEEKNQSLTSTLMALSTQVGSLQVREEELSSMLKLKDKDVTEATGRLRDLEASLTESRSRETKLLRDMEENKRRYREAKHAASHLKGELQQQITQSSSQREEIIRLKQELQILFNPLFSSLDELLELTRSKQERTKSELCCLQQVPELSEASGTRRHCSYRSQLSRHVFPHSSFSHCSHSHRSVSGLAAYLSVVLLFPHCDSVRVKSGFWR
uniref:Coiled-coil domain containing 62 n=1 Tax=Echeneis naucrates TaxID=173247 RepID=A0A665U8K6_ECHNA